MGASGLQDWANIYVYCIGMRFCTYKRYNLDEMLVYLLVCIWNACSRVLLGNERTNHVQNIASNMRCVCILNKRTLINLKHFVTSWCIKIWKFEKGISCAHRFIFVSLAWFLCLWIYLVCVFLRLHFFFALTHVQIHTYIFNQLVILVVVVFLTLWFLIFIPVLAVSII